MRENSYVGVVGLTPEDISNILTHLRRKPNDCLMACRLLLNRIEFFLGQGGGMTIICDDHYLARIKAAHRMNEYPLLRTVDFPTVTPEALLDLLFLLEVSK